MKIIIDKREKNSLIASELISLGAQIEFKHLLIADYIISKDIAIERKTLNDFISSMINKRIIFQLKDMKKNFKKPILLIEGMDEKDLYKPFKHPKINANAVKGMILSIITDFQIPIIFSRDSQDSASYIFLLAKKELKEKRPFSLKLKRTPFNLREQQEIIVESFPGIGPSLSKNILKHFKSIKQFINSPIKELEKIPKLGKKKAGSIKSLIEKKY